MANKYLIGYPPKKHNNNIIENKIAAVEKLAGNMRITTKNEGSHKGKILSVKVTSLSLIFVK